MPLPSASHTCEAASLCFCTLCAQAEYSEIRQKTMALEDDPYAWEKYARESQRIPSGDWKTWMILAGRGFGKTRTGAETIRHWIETKQAKRICLLGHTFQEVRRVMIEGVSGLLSVFPPDERPIYSASTNTLTWPCGAKAYLYSADSYNQLRGPQFDAAWVDELAKFTYPQEAWDQLMMGMRLSQCPRVIVTTTPRPLPLIRDLLNDPSVHVTRGSTFENAAHLSPVYLNTMKERYAHTPLGLQELEGEVIDTSGPALWSSSGMSQCYWDTTSLPSFSYSIIAVDPAVTSHHESDETGIIVMGVTHDRKVIVRADLSGRYTPLEWAQKVIDACHTFGISHVVTESNNGGDLVPTLLRTLNPSILCKTVRATYSKHTRAEPVAALYAQGKVFHAHSFPLLEEQMCLFPHGKSSFDRLDALVWGITDLMLTPRIIPAAPRVWCGT